MKKVIDVDSRSGTNMLGHMSTAAKRMESPSVINCDRWKGLLSLWIGDVV